jgi:transposase
LAKLWKLIFVVHSGRSIRRTVLRLLKELAVRIREDEKTLEGSLEQSPVLKYVRSLPGTGPILAAVVVTEIDGIERFPRLSAPSPQSSPSQGEEDASAPGEGHSRMSVTRNNPPR